MDGALGTRHAYQQMGSDADKSAYECSDRYPGGSHPGNEQDTHKDIHGSFGYGGDGRQMLTSGGHDNQDIRTRKLPNNITDHQNLKVERALDCILVPYPEREQWIGSK